ncbi:MAG: esterase-like activity of phytase family protein [Pseudobdellovibrionaceae bacterium]
MKIALPFLGSFLLTLTSCLHSPSPTSVSSGPHVQLDLFTLENPQVLGTTLSGDSVLAGGFSGLLYLGKTSEGEWQFLTLTDRGPNGNPVSISGVDPDSRPFLLPEFQPRIFKLQTDSKTKSFKVIDEILLTDPRGQPLSGKPQWINSKKKESDEKAMDLRGKALSADLMGLDSEGMTQDSEGHFWICEEYRPSLLKFDSDGRLLKRFIPKNSLPTSELKKLRKLYGPQVVVEALPEIYKQRKSNRGFEGLTFSNGKIYALLQSPLEVANSEHKSVIRMIEFDVKTEKVSGEFLYPLTRDGVDKIGDLSVLPGGSELYVIEQNSKSGPQGTHLITKIDLSHRLRAKAPEKTPLPQLKTENQLLEPTLYLSLAEIGYDFAEKVEGLAMISEKQLAVVNDNDFGVNGDFDLAQQKVPLTKDRKTVLGVITLSTKASSSP